MDFLCPLGLSESHRRAAPPHTIPLVPLPRCGPLRRLRLVLHIYLCGTKFGSCEQGPSGNSYSRLTHAAGSCEGRSLFSPDERLAGGGGHVQPSVVQEEENKGGRHNKQESKGTGAGFAAAGCSESAPSEDAAGALAGGSGPVGQPVDEEEDGQAGEPSGDDVGGDRIAADEATAIKAALPLVEGYLETKEHYGDARIPTGNAVSTPEKRAELVHKTMSQQQTEGGCFPKQTEFLS